MAEIRPDDISYLAGLVRETDRPRYYATLFAREPKRSDLFALYGFAAEIERIPAQVTDPTLGLIRLQWWRDALAAGTEVAVEGQNPALRAVNAVIARHALPVPPLLASIDARSADLYADPPPSMAELENLFGKTDGTLFRLAAIILGETGAEISEASRHAGIAFGLARRLATCALDRGRSRTIFPADLLAIEGLSPADVFAADPPVKLRNIVAALSSLSRHHLRAAEAHLPRATPAFLPLAIVEPLLRKIDQLDAEILVRPVSLSDLETLLRIFVAWLRRGPAGR